MARIHMIGDDEAAGDVPRVFAGVRATYARSVVPDIMRTMSLRPDLLRLMSEAADQLRFSDGYLSRAHHEMVASYVAALTRCHY